MKPLPECQHLSSYCREPTFLPLVWWWPMDVQLTALYTSVFQLAFGLLQGPCCSFSKYSLKNVWGKNVRIMAGVCWPPVPMTRGNIGCPTCLKIFTSSPRITGAWLLYLTVQAVRKSLERFDECICVRQADQLLPPVHLMIKKIPHNLNSPFPLYWED